MSKKAYKFWYIVHIYNSNCIPTIKMIQLGIFSLSHARGVNLKSYLTILIRTNGIQFKWNHIDCLWDVLHELKSFKYTQSVYVCWFGIVAASKALFTDSCRWQNFRPSLLRLVHKRLGRKFCHLQRSVNSTLTTIPFEPGFLWEFVLLKLKICSLYHEKLFIQKFNDMITQVLNGYFSASDIMEAVRGHFLFYAMDFCGSLKFLNSKPVHFR